MNELTKLGKGATVALVALTLAALAGAGILAGALVKTQDESLVPAGDHGAASAASGTPVAPTGVVGPPAPTASPSATSSPGSVVDVGGVVTIPLASPWH